MSVLYKQTIRTHSVFMRATVEAAFSLNLETQRWAKDCYEGSRLATYRRFKCKGLAL